MAETAISSQLAPGESYAEAAMVMHFFSGLMIPKALKLAVASFKNIAKTDQIARVGDDWLEASTKLGEAVEEAFGVDRDLSDANWSGLDRAAFTLAVGRYCASSLLSAALCAYVGVVLIASAMMIFLVDLMLLISGIIISALVVLIIICMACSAIPVVGPAFQAAEKALRTAANFCATTFEANIKIVSDLFTKLQVQAASYMARMAVVEMAGQVFTGNISAIKNLAAGALDSAGDMLKGTLELAIRNLKALALGGKFPPPEYWPGGDSRQPEADA